MSRSTAVLLSALAGIILGILGTVVVHGSGSGGNLELEFGGSRGITRSVSEESHIEESTHQGADNQAIPTSGFKDSIESLLDRVPTGLEEGATTGEASLTGGGVIIGRVFAEDGRPLGGVTIRLWQRKESADDDFGEDHERPIAYKPGDPPPDDADLRTKLSTIVDAERRKLRGLRQSSSSDNGDFRFEGLEHASYRIEGFRQGYLVRPTGNQDSSILRPGCTVTMSATRVYRRRVEVLMPDGSVAQSAVLTNRLLSSDEEWGLRNHRWSPEDPMIRFTIGVHELIASQGKGWPLRSAPIRVSVTSEDSNDPIQFQLRSTSGVRGRVTCTSELDASSISVHILRIQDGQLPDDSGLLSTGKAFGCENGRFGDYFFYDEKPGTYRLGVQVDNTGIIQSETISITEGSILVRDFKIEETLDQAGVLVRLINPEGGSCPSGFINIVSDFTIPQTIENGVPQQSYHSGPWKVRRRSDGAFLVHRVKASPSDNIPRFVQANNRKYGTKCLPLPPSGTGELEMRFDFPSLVNVTLVDSGGQSSKSTPMSVRLRKDGLNPSEPPIIYSARFVDGRATLGPLQPGSYAASVSLRRRTKLMPMPSTQIQVLPGINEVSVTAPQLHSIKVSFDQLLKPDNISLLILDQNGSTTVESTRMGSDGIAVFDGLFSGPYRIQVSTQDGPQFMEIQVPSPGVIKFTSVVEYALQVIRVSPGGFFEKSGLQVNDTIIGVNGQSFSGERPAQQILNGQMMSRRTSTLIVERAGGRVEIVVEGSGVSQEISSRTVKGLLR